MKKFIIFVTIFTFISCLFLPGNVSSSISNIIVYKDNVVIETFTGYEGHVIQSAINYAYNNGGNKVYLESGTYYLNQYIQSALMKCGIFLPDNIEFCGNASNRPIIKVHPNFNTPLDTMLLVQNQCADPYVDLNSINIHDLEFDGGWDGNLDGTYKAANAIWCGKSANGAWIDIYNNKITKVRRTAILVGYVGDYIKESPTSDLSYIFYCNGRAGHYSEIYNNVIEDCGRDGITIVGCYHWIHHNVIQRLQTPVQSNGISGYCNAQLAIIEYNTINESNCGISLDGSYPAYLGDVTGNLDEYRDNKGKGNEVGFCQSIQIRKNSLYNNTRGINLWRARLSHVYDNDIVRTFGGYKGEGINVEDSRDNYIYGNRIKAHIRNIQIKSYGFSAIGARYNHFGDYPLGNEWLTWGNITTDGDYGVAQIAHDISYISDNVFTNNQYINPRLAPFVTIID